MSVTEVTLDFWTPYEQSRLLPGRLLLIQLARYYEAQRDCEHCQSKKRELDKQGAFEAAGRGAGDNNERG